MDREEMTRKHIIGVLSSYTGKTLTSDVLPKLADDISQSVKEVNESHELAVEDIPQ